MSLYFDRIDRAIAVSTIRKLCHLLCGRRLRCRRAADAIRAHGFSPPASFSLTRLVLAKTGSRWRFPLGFGSKDSSPIISSPCQFLPAPLCICTIHHAGVLLDGRRTFARLALEIRMVAHIEARQGGRHKRVLLRMDADTVRSGQNTRAFSAA